MIRAGLALRPGDQVRFEDEVWTVTSVGGSVRLVDDAGRTRLVLLASLLSSVGFALLGSAGESQRAQLEPVSLLETLPPEVLARARDWEGHVLEVETGLALGASTPRPGFDPTSTTIEERDHAKAEELTAAGQPTGARTVKRMRARYRSSGLWGLVDHRHTRPVSPHGRVDDRVVAATRAAITAETPRSTGTKTRLRRAVEQALVAQHGAGMVAMPSRRTFERLVDALAAGLHTFGPATSRRTHANRPDAPFTPTAAARPGELVQIDTTPLDVMAVLDDGVVGRVELTIALDIATRTITAAVLRPHGTKSVDAALLLARTLVPEPMRPGWPEALSMSRSRIPHARLLTLDTRLEQAAAKPVIAPETVIVDRGKAFISDTFLRACERLEISVQPAHPRSPTEKAMVERTFGSINTLFCQHVAGYTGSSVTQRGTDVDQHTVWTLPQLQDLFDEWVLAGWQTRPHDSLRDPHLSTAPLSPNDMYSALITAAGYVPLTLIGEDYLELLPVEWRRVNHDGIHLDHRTYDDPALGPLRRQDSGITSKGGRWAVHYDPYDLSHVWIRNHWTGGWITAAWTQLRIAPQPFAEFTWRAARDLVVERGGDDTNESDVARALDALLTRAGQGPARQRRALARTRSAPSTLPFSAPLHSDPAAAPTRHEPAELAKVIPFGIFDPAAEEPYR